MSKKHNKSENTKSSCSKPQQVIKKETDKKVIILTIVPIIISCLALVVSCYMAYSQARYAEAEYEYKRDPKFSVTATIVPHRMANGVNMHIVTNFDVDIVLKNNIDKLYVVSPEKEVKQIFVNDEVSEQITKYFKEEYKDKEPDIFTENNQTAYFYRFIIYSTINNSMDIKILFGKTTITTPEGFLDFQVVDEIKLLEFEKAHINDPHFQGEKQIAKEYRELEEYFQK